MKCLHIIRLHWRRSRRRIVHSTRPRPWTQRASRILLAVCCCGWQSSSAVVKDQSRIPPPRAWSPHATLPHPMAPGMPVRSRGFRYRLVSFGEPSCQAMFLPGEERCFGELVITCLDALHKLEILPAMALSHPNHEFAHLDEFVAPFRYVHCQLVSHHTECCGDFLSTCGWSGGRCAGDGIQVLRGTEETA